MRTNHKHKYFFNRTLTRIRSYLLIFAIFLCISGCAANQPEIEPVGEPVPHSSNTHVFRPPAPKDSSIKSSSNHRFYEANTLVSVERQGISENAFKYFMEIAFGSEYAMGDFTIKKWTENIRLEVIGYPTVKDLEIVSQVSEELNELIGGELQIKQVPSDGNVKMHFIPHSEFYQYEPPGILFSGGFFWNWWHYGGVMDSARIVIGSDRVSQTERAHLIREELTQMLGLMNDSMKYEDSIFYQGRTKTQHFSELDQTVIKILYSDTIFAGMTVFEVRDFFKQGKF